jgi:hypothetical protein
MAGVSYIKGFVIFLLLLSLSSSSDLIHPTAVGVMSVLLLFSTTLIAIAYMVGNVLGIEKLKVWAKHEIGEVIGAVLIFALLSFFITSADNVSKALVQMIDKPGYDAFCTIQTLPDFKYTNNGNDIDPGYASLPCHMKVAENYLTSIFYETAALFKSIGLAYSILSYLTTFSLSASIQAAGRVLSAASMTTNFFLMGPAKAKVHFYSFMFKYLVRLLMVLRFQEIILRFIAIALFPILLSLGVGLRAFFLTRKLGGLLIAISLSLYYIYPFFFVVGDAIYYNVAYLHNYDIQHPNPKDNPVLAKTKIEDKLMAVPGFNAKMKMDENGQIVVEKDPNILEEQKKPETEIVNIKKASDKQGGKISNTSICNDIAEEWEKIKDLKENDIKNFLPEYMMNRYFTELMEKHVGKMSLLPKGFKQNLYALDLLARLMFFSTFFSFIAVIATIANIKVLSPMLGGDVEIAGLTRLI